MTGFAKWIAAAATAGFFAFTALPAQAASIYETLKGDPQFSILVQIIDGAGLKWRYEGEETRTVFAPTNTAFQSIMGGYEDMLPPLNSSTKENVSALLLYQIVPGRQTPENLAGKTTTLTTYQRGKVSIDGTQDPIHYGGQFGGKVTGAAITADNGLVVPINGVPMPSFEEVNPAPAEDTSR